MFKKTLIAATLAAMSTSAMAVDVNNVGTLSYTYGNEALTNGQTKNDFTAVELNAVVLELGAAYSVGDIIKVNITGAEFKADDTYALDTSDALVIEVGFLSATANQLVFRVTTAAAGTDAENLTLAAGSKIKLDTLAVDAKVTVSATAETSTGITIDAQGTDDSKVVGTVIQQHKFVVTTSLNEKIDVSEERKELDSVTLDTATVTYTMTDPTFAATDFDTSGAGEITMKATGSYTGFEDAQNSSTNLGVITLGTIDSTVAVDLQSGSAALGATAASTTFDAVFTPDTGATTKVVLNVSAYTFDFTLNDGANSTSYTGLAGGSFVLNGSSAQYAYVPVNYDGAVTTQFEIGNSGVLDGEITLTAFDTVGNTYSAVLPFNAEAGKLTKVSDADISTAFALTAGTKLNLTITVNAPNEDITYGAYSNRGTTGRMAISKL